MKATATSKAVTCLMTALVLASPVVVAREYTNVVEAILALSESTRSDRRDAVEYLAQHPEQSVTLLMQLVKNQGQGWMYGSNALIRSKDERVVLLYIDLLQNNYYDKEADGTRKQHGRIMGLYLFGGRLASGLGELGDPRAIPTLKEAVIQGDSYVREKAHEALYKLGAVSLDDLFDMAKKGSDPEADIPRIIWRIGSASIHSDTHHALKVFERVIAELPQHEYPVAMSHFGRVQCFTIQQEYDKAFLECSEAMKFPQYEKLMDLLKSKQEELILLVDGNSGQEKAGNNQAPRDTAHKLVDPER